MLSLRTNVNTNLLPATYIPYFPQPQIKPLIVKQKTLLPTMKNATRKIQTQRADFLSMGLVMPFQPSMWDEKMLETAWNDAIKMIQKKMKEEYATECIDKLMARLKDIFSRLNFNTHRKSIAVNLSADKEKITYLNFPVKPVVLFSKNISVLELAANNLQEADFYYLVLNKDYSGLYDYNNHQLRMVHEQKNEPVETKLFKGVVAVIGLLSTKNEKPIFVTGSPNQVEQFCKSEYYAEIYFPLQNHKAPFSIGIIQSLVKEITSRWSYWRLKFMEGSVLLAQKTNRLISHKKAVLQALRRGADGLLLIDKRLKHQLQKPSNEYVVLQKGDELISLIEKFLTRGNCFEITETGLLKELGGIVLLKNNTPGSSAFEPSNTYKKYGGSLY
jgi:hypothetical protein